ncbi:MAG TPA: hypothetical protein VMB46_06160 [Methanomassiliicoccales archaeon]|nr:hypothetical protein [Methanomassiliicoccales archaeon]
MTGKPVDDKTARPIWRGLLSTRGLAVLVAIALLLATGLILAVPGQEPLLTAGDRLVYDLTGEFSNTTGTHQVRGNTTIDIGQWDSSGYSYNSLGQIEGANSTPDLRPNDVKFSFTTRTGYEPGIPFATERIATPFGEKWVVTSVKMANDLVVVSSVGHESGLVYRVVVSMPDFFYRMDLAFSNATSLNRLDQDPYETTYVSSDHPLEEPHLNMVGPYANGGRTGSVQVGPGDRIRYEIINGSMSAQFYSIDELRSIESDGRYACNATLSVDPGYIGEINETAVPGTYWFFMTTVTSANWTAILTYF